MPATAACRTTLTPWAIVVASAFLTITLAGCGDDAAPAAATSSATPSSNTTQETTAASTASIQQHMEDAPLVPSPAPAQPPSQSPARDVTMFTQHKLHDPGMNNMPSHTLLVPRGWQVEGGLQRMAPMLYNMPVIIDLKLTAPDGRRARFLPSLSFEYGPNPNARPWQPLQSGNLFMPMPQSLGQWIVQQAQQNPEPGVADIRLLDEKPIEAVTQQLRQMYQPLYETVAQTNQIGASMGFGSWFDTQAQSIRISYTRDGQPWEETIFASWMAMANLRNNQNHSGTWSILAMFSVREKPGVDPTNDPLFRTIFQSLQPTPQWQQQMQAYFAELNRIRSKGHQERQQQFARTNKIIRENNAQISDMIYDGWKSRQASSDRMQAKTIDAIREVTPYSTPDGQTVKLPSHYNHVYSDGQGNYLLHNDANYNPNTDPALNNHRWQTIEQAR